MADYPDRLIPSPRYAIMGSDELMSQPGLWLIRHIESDMTVFLGNTNTIDPDCIKIQSGHLRDLSNNLLGVFQKEDVYYGIEKSVAGKYYSLWDGKETCAIPEEGHFFRDDKRGYYFIPTDTLLKSNISISNLADGTQEVYHFRILHTPTKCNYWHISIRVYDIDNNEVSELKITNGRRDRIWKAVRDYLITSVVKTDAESDFAILEPSVYHLSPEA